MLATSDLQELRHKRVAVDLSSGPSPVGILTGVTDEKLFIGQDSYPMDDVIAVTPAPLFCSTCGDPANLLFDGLDAKCYREDASRKPTPREPCEICGAAAVRQPGTDLFLCATHHAQAGNHLQLHGSSRNMLAECATEDVTSDKHEWKQVRGARFRCVRCLQAEKWDPELLKNMSMVEPEKD